MNDTAPRLYTIGHSTRTMAEFLALLRENGIETVADVRSFPGSRRFPHFGKDALRDALEQAGIRYIHMVSLGGRRKAQDVPIHDTKWRNPAFSNYADYATTAPFRAALAELESLARQERVAVMCAEALWWRCHRRIIAEEAEKDGFAIVHIMGRERAKAAEPAPTLPGL